MAARDGVDRLGQAVKPLWDAAAPDVKGWPLIVHLVPADDGVVPQYAMPLAAGWGMTQGRDNGTGSNATDDLILTWFPDGGKRETRTVQRGGHGDRAYRRGGKLVTLIKGVWSQVTFGSPWDWSKTDTPDRCALRSGAGCQGEAYAGEGRWLRLYGESIKGGSERDWSHRTAFLQIIDGTKVVGKVDLDHVARDGKGEPIGGRYEPEGVFVDDRNGEPWVLVGFAVGRLGSTTMNVYGRPLRLVLED